MTDDQKWYPVARTSDLAPGGLMYVEVGRDPVVLINKDGQFYALSDICTHQDASLSDGEIFGDEIECPFHGGSFDICTGQPTSFPVVVPVETYDIRVEGDVVFAARKNQ